MIRSNCDVKKIKENENGAVFRVTVRVPAEIGWIDNMTMIVEKGNYNYHNKINYKEMDNDEVVFESDIELPTCAIYRYYFDYLVNGNHRKIKAENTTDRKSVV